MSMSHKRHSDDRWVDEIRITTAPRWKESELSGDEWRFSYAATLYRKGVAVGTCFGGSMSQILARLTVAAVDGFCPANQPWPKEQTPGHSYGDGYLCDQPGCPDRAVWRGVMYREWDNGNEVDSALTRYRVFCDRHKQRGDCDLEDADDNYAWQRLEESE